MHSPAEDELLTRIPRMTLTLRGRVCQFRYRYQKLMSLDALFVIAAIGIVRVRLVLRPV